MHVQGVVEGKVGVVVKPDCGGKDIDSKEGNIVGFGEGGDRRRLRGKGWSRGCVH